MATPDVAPETAFENEITVAWWDVNHSKVENGIKFSGIPLSPRFTSREQALTALEAIKLTHPEAKLGRWEAYFDRRRPGELKEAEALRATIV